MVLEESTELSGWLMELGILFTVVILCSLVTLVLLAPVQALAIPHLSLWTGLAIALPLLAWLLKD